VAVAGSAFVVGSAFMLVLLGGPLGAQPAGRRAARADTVVMARASLYGVVMDAASDRPIVAALVTLRGGPAGGIDEGDDDRTMAHRCASQTGRDERAVSAVGTDRTGAYRFGNLTPGRYTVCVRAVGYAARALSVTLEAASAPRVHVGLPALPTMLAPVRITRVPGATFAGVRASGSPDTMGAMMERLRQESYLTSDTRLLTIRDASLAPGLGERDVMRAVQQLPGVAARDDYTVAPWTRGAPGDQTRVTFDGLPLLGPYHGVGAVSAVNVDAIGEAAFHPGVAPTELPGGAAGTLALRSRRPTAPGVHGALGASSIAASMSVDAATRGRRAAGTLSLRRSHLDLTNRWAARLGADSRGELPYAFDDVAGRGDVTLGGWHLEGSALLTRDRLWAPIAGMVDGGTGRWGGHAARLTLSRAVYGGELRASVGESASKTSLLAESDARLEPAALPQDSGLYAVRETVFRPQPIESRAEVRVAAVNWHGESDALGVSHGAAGIEVAMWRARFATEGPWPHTGQFIDTIAVRSAATITTLWADRLWQPAAVLSLRTGARLEVGAASRNARRLRLAPRLSMRYAPSAVTSFSLAAGGTYQHAQTLAPPGPGRNAVATTDAFWLVSGPDVPTLATRIATVGAERWMTPTVLASATAYWRDDLGVLLADPRAGYLVDRPLAVEGRGRAAGLETSLRALGPRWTGDVSYSLGRSTVTAYGLRFASPSERPRVLRVRAAVPARRRSDAATNVRFGLAWEHAAGAPFTRYYGSVARCDAAQRCRWEPPPRIGPPSDGRGRATQRLDASVDAAWATRRVLVEGYVQVRNVTRAVNDAAYLASVGRCPSGTQAAGTCHPELFPDTVDDTRLPPLRGWLSVGVRLSRQHTP
jgi:hypothetical protein